MKNSIIALLSFAMGAGAGILATRQYFDKKYSDISQEEIDSVKAAFKMQENTEVSPHKEENEVDDDSDQLEDEVNDVIEQAGYSRPSQKVEYETHMPKKRETSKQDTKPVTEVITPEVFGTNDDFDEIELIYWTDGVVTCDDEVIDDVDDLIGDALEHFGDYEDDAVHVRNYKYKVDYEVLMDNRSYHETAAEGPKRIELED